MTSDPNSAVTDAPVSPIPSGVEGKARPAPNSYGQIFRAAGLIGGASVVQIVLGVVRTKFMAVWLGPSGVGLMGLYISIMELSAQAAALGTSHSGVRQIAEAAGSGDQRRMAVTAATLRQIVLVLGLLGAAVTCLLSPQISKLTFGDTRHAGSVALLSAAVFFTTVSGGQSALIQGLRRIIELAKIRVLGALVGTIIGIGLVAYWREAAIVPLLVVLSMTSLLASWWYARRIPLVAVVMGFRETLVAARSLLGLGLVFLVNGLLLAAVAYFTRMIVLREMGVESVGHYTAAFTLAGLYVGFILNAMGTEFYPRLTGVARDNATVNRMVNEQTEISLLLALPGLLGTLTFAPLVITLFYSGQFEPAGEVLRWQVLGVLGRVISWPMAFILLARGANRKFLFSEVATSTVHVALIWLGVRFGGLPGTGMAFFGLYVFYVLLMVLLSRQESGFRWSPNVIKLLAWMLPAMVVVFLATASLPRLPGMLVGGAVSVICGWVCLKGLVRCVPAHRLGRFAFLAR